MNVYAGWMENLSQLGGISDEAAIAVGLTVAGLLAILPAFMLQRRGRQSLQAVAENWQGDEQPKTASVLRQGLAMAFAALVGPIIYRLTGGPTVSLVAALAAMLFARRAANLSVGFSARLRRSRIDRGLTSMIEMMVLCAEAGLGLDAMLGRISHEIARAYPELAEELSHMARDLALLPDRLLAYRGLVRRNPSPGLGEVAVALERTEFYGTPLLPVLNRLHREAMEAEARRVEGLARKMPVYLVSVLVILFMPAVMLILVGPSYVRLMSVLHRVGERALSP